MSLEMGGLVFLVDDDKDLWWVIFQMLELVGYDVQFFVWVCEVFVVLLEDFVGVVVSDICMFEMDGLQFFVEING